MTLRGCANTASGKPNNKTQDAPKEPSIKGWPEYWPRTATAAMAKLEPSQAIAMQDSEGLGGSALPLFLILILFLSDIGYSQLKGCALPRIPSFD